VDAAVGRAPLADGALDGTAQRLAEAPALPHGLAGRLGGAVGSGRPGCDHRDSHQRSASIAR
jgi:hypothetical protein